MNKEEKLMLKELYSSANADQRIILEKLVPELKESEDEWIRKWIIDDIKYNIDNEPLNNSEYKKQGEKAIAWLEKQSKKEYALKSCEDEDVRKFMQFFEKRAKAYEIELPNRGYDIYALAKDILAWLEKQGGQKDIINSQSDYVDLGLPSGTLWAKCNLGAEKETDFGLYYQWGVTQGFLRVGERQFNWYDYKWYDNDNITKYNETDNKLVLDNEDDPVFVATNGMFKSPTKKQVQELIKHTDHKWTTIDGVNGMKFTNKNNDTKYIFIPATGYCSAGGHYSVGSWGSVWSASCKGANANDAWCMYFNPGNVGMHRSYRCCGFSMRGVLNK